MVRNNLGHGGLDTVAEMDGVQTVIDDRRRRKRYHIRLAVDVTGATPSHRLISGWSVDISSIGVRIESEALARYQPFQPGATVVIAADWPVLHNQLTPLRLIMIGELVRSTSSDLVVRIQRYYFEPQSR
jgi:hypothetical protein